MNYRKMLKYFILNGNKKYYKKHYKNKHIFIMFFSCYRKNQRIQKSLGYLTPIQYKEKELKKEKVLQ